MIACHICAKSFRKDNLQRHISSVHSKNKNYCNNCGKSFSTKGAVTRHMKTSCKPTTDFVQFIGNEQLTGGLHIVYCE